MMRAATSILIALLLVGCARSAREVDVKIPSPTFWLRTPFPASYFIALPWCVNTSVMIKMIRVGRRLTNGEAWTLIGNCYVPLVGGHLVEHAWGDHPEWNKYPLDINDPSQSGSKNEVR